jgi:hypothetical protein
MSNQRPLQYVHAVGAGIRVPDVDDPGGVADQADLHAGVRVGDEIFAVEGAAQLLIEPLLLR